MAIGINEIDIRKMTILEDDVNHFWVNCLIFNFFVHFVRGDFDFTN